MPHPAEEHAALTAAMRDKFAERHPGVVPVTEPAEIDLWGFATVPLYAASADGVMWWVPYWSVIRPTGVEPVALGQMWQESRAEHCHQDADLVLQFSPVNPSGEPLLIRMVAMPFVVRAFCAGPWQADFLANTRPWFARMMLAGHIETPAGLTTSDLVRLAAIEPDDDAAISRAMSGPLGAFWRAHEQGSRGSSEADDQ